MVMWEFVAFCLRSWTHLDKVFVLEESIWAGASWVQQITWWGGKLGAETKEGMGERMGLELNTCLSIDTGVYVRLGWMWALFCLCVCSHAGWGWGGQGGRDRAAPAHRDGLPREQSCQSPQAEPVSGQHCLALQPRSASTHICSFLLSLCGSPQWRLEEAWAPRSAASGTVQVAQGREIMAGCALQGLGVTGLPGWHCFQVSNSHFLQLSKSDFTEERANLAHPHWPFSCRNIHCADL